MAIIGELTSEAKGKVTVFKELSVNIATCP